VPVVDVDDRLISRGSAASNRKQAKKCDVNGPSHGAPLYSTHSSTDVSPMEPGHHPHPSLLVSILLAAFIIWRFYARIRRMVVRQKLSKVRPWITVCVFPIVLVLFAVLSISHGVDLASLFGGAVVGIGLGLYGTRLTRFEKTPEGMYY